MTLIRSTHGIGPASAGTNCAHCAGYALPMTRAKAEAAVARSAGLCAVMACPNGRGYHLLAVPESGDPRNQAAGL